MENNCCEKCIGTEVEIGRPREMNCKYGEMMPSCPCHTPTPPVEGWEKIFSNYQIKNEWHPDATPLDVKNLIKHLLHSQRQTLLSKVDEVENVDGFAERVVIEYANTSGRDDNRTHVREAVRKVFSDYKEALKKELDTN